ncbi:zinc finger protein ZAT5-like [Cucurbita moschata]|uniref:Zinc finger protein ZAT5-like n=1 Tax=Cucurbita moschata TaxID=3662 RepID=A0A6J1FLT9_CUCMO|nr:zinc finger protein ZAT5-like [Cucurbita moschata]
MNPNGFSEPNSELLGRCNLSSSSSSIGGGGGGGGGSGGEDEQEDVAKCLILLSQGLPASQPSSSMVKFIEAPQGQNGAGKAAECYAYECKTCSRTFPSFRALGGHRSSHKNPAMAAGDQKSISGTSPAYKHQQQRLNNTISSPFDPLRMNRTGYYHKTHEFSVCGSGFTSVQALSGHMRRHRRGCGRDSGEIAHRRPQRHRSNLLCLELDLNLPAAEEDKRDRSGVVSMAAMDRVSSHYREHRAFLIEKFRLNYNF